jgi:hypothetical protein
MELLNKCEKKLADFSWGQALRNLNDSGTTYRVSQEMDCRLQLIPSLRLLFVNSSKLKKQWFALAQQMHMVPD